MTPKIVLEPTEELLTIDECRLHLRVDRLEIDSDDVGTHPDDELIMALQTAAREHCEAFLGLSLVPYTYEVALSSFPADNDGAHERDVTRRGAPRRPRRASPAPRRCAWRSR